VLGLRQRGPRLVVASGTLIIALGPALCSPLNGVVGIKKWQIVPLAKLFKMKGNPEFHKAGKISKSSFVQRYSEKARRVSEPKEESDSDRQRRALAGIADARAA
jgi:hypothetical protein